MSRHANFLAITFLVLLPLIYFWQITLAQGVWFGNDMVRTYYPLGVELGRALQQGRIPLWTTGMYAGFPILADAQIGALYPVNLVLFRLLPAHWALAYSMLLHLAWAGLGMYLLARSFGLRTASALLAGIVFAFNGFMFARLEHATVLTTSAWLPWSPFLWEQFQRARTQNSSKAGLWFSLVALSLGVQFLCGFPQVAFMNTLTFALFAFFGSMLWHSSKVVSLKTMLTISATVVLAMVLAIGVAAAQILPTLELVGLSVRGGGTNFQFATSYSLPLDSLPHLIFPLWQGEPSEGINNEYWANVGLAPLILAILAPFLRRDRRTIFLALFALVALALALGEANPAYGLIYQLPGFSFFRAPARYLLLFVFGCALLSASAFDTLAHRLTQTPARSRPAWLWGATFGILLVVSIVWAEVQPIEFWLTAWQILPAIFAAATLVLLVLAWQRRTSSATFRVIMVGLVLIDLTALAPLFMKTLGQITPSASVTTVPRSLAAMDTAPGNGRVLADQSIFPSVPAIRNSLYPNTALLYGKESADAYSSLASARHVLYLHQLSPMMLNLLNVQYFSIPLEPRPRTKNAIPWDGLTLDVLNNEEMISPTPATVIEIASFTEQAEQLAEGTVVGQVEVRQRDGRIDVFPLRVGIETADWDYERKKSQHQRAPIAHSFPGFWRAFGRAFEGHTYLAKFALEPGEIIGVSVRVERPDVYLTIEDLTLYNEQGQPQSLAKLVGKNNFRVAYFSDTVAVWKNLDALPRAFIVHSAQIADDYTALARLQEPDFPADRLALLADGEPLNALSSRDSVEIVAYQPERVQLSARTEQPGYLFLADSWYPGWHAMVDGRAAPIYRANVLFRAVPIEPGTHTIVFEYRPGSFVLGATISIISILVLVIIPLIFHSRTKSL